MTAPLGFEIEEAEGADLGRVEAGRAQTCDTCGSASYTGPRCTRCTYAGAPSPPWPVVVEGSQKILAQNPAEPVEAVAPEFVCPGEFCHHPAPGPVGDLRRAAIVMGWKVQVRHSRGTPAGARTVSDLWSVRFRRPGWAGYAVRVGESWKSVAVSGATLPPFLALTVTDLRTWLAGPDQPAEWYDKIRKQVADADLAKKIRACPGPGECEWVDQGRGDHTHRANGEIKIKKGRKERVTGA